MRNKDASTYRGVRVRCANCRTVLQRDRHSQSRLLLIAQAFARTKYLGRLCSRGHCECMERWKELCVYTSNGILQIDNNLVENSIRPVALGRKNYLFAGGHDLAQDAAILYSLFTHAGCIMSIQSSGIRLKISTAIQRITYTYCCPKLYYSHYRGMTGFANGIQRK